MEPAVITIGQLGFDPMRVPAPARGAEPRGDRFEQALERAARPESTAPPAAEPAPAPETATPPAPTPTPDSVQANAAPAATAPAAVGTHPASTEAGDPARRIEPGKGAGSPASSPFFSVLGPAGSAPAVAIDPATVGAMPSPTAIPPAGIVPAPAPPGAPAAATAARAPALPGAATTPAGTTRAATPVLAGYRSLSPATLQLAEAARDSVFRQIALRVDGDGGELRLLLDPPELGELDLRLVVEKGGALRLSIGAERPELLLAIDKHMHELRHALAMHGLDVAQAEVHARERGSERDSGGDPAPWRPLQSEPAAPAQSLRTDGEWWTAEGFALWA